MIGFSNHLYYFPHLPVANVRPIYPDFPKAPYVPKSTVPPGVEQALKDIFYFWATETDVYGSRNLYNYPSYRAYVSNYIAQFMPEIEDVQLHSGFADAVFATFQRESRSTGLDRQA